MGTNYPHLSARTRWLRWAGARAGRRPVYMRGRCSELKATYCKRHKARGTWLSLGYGECTVYGVWNVWPPVGGAIERTLRRRRLGGEADGKGGSAKQRVACCNPSIQKTGRKVKCERCLRSARAHGTPS